MTDTPVWLRLMLFILLTVLFGSLTAVVLSLPDTAMGLHAQVMSHLDRSGVTNPVTAVLINFRAYDTLLEMAVLMLAMLAVWSTATAPSALPQEAVSHSILEYLSRLLIPFMLIVAVYLLWAGAKQPGGAFQAGSVLAAMGVLMRLSGWPWPSQLPGWPLRLLLTLGLMVFIIVGAMMMLPGGRFLEYPPALAGTLILVIEAAATVSIGVTLTSLFWGGRLEHHR